MRPPLWRSMISIARSASFFSLCSPYPASSLTIASAVSRWIFVLPGSSYGDSAASRAREAQRPIRSKERRRRSLATGRSGTFA